MSVDQTIFEYSSPGRVGVALPESDVSSAGAGELLGSDNLRDDLPLPEVNQVDVIRHFTKLSLANYSVDRGFYPLGSCTMKYNPKINEELASLPGFSELHPYQDESQAQGTLAAMYATQEYIKAITGFDAVTLQPAAGAQGEFTAMMVFKKHHEKTGQGHRHIVIVPDSSHGTNPATAARCGYGIKKTPSGPDGRVDLDALKEALNDEVAAVMLTNPNTLGLFESQIAEICAMVHDAGALIYCDGANMNAVMGWYRPGDSGFDAMHLNLHKTFSTPHGGGGPGSGPVAVKGFLAPYLPVPNVNKQGERYFLDYGSRDSIGRVHGYYGNIAIVLRACVYILSQGGDGLKNVSENAVLNANYLMSKLSDAYEVPHNTRCMHEFVASASKQKELGVKALDIAKRLIDFGYHPPTIYFPLIVPEALMIEPTETESIETLDSFIEAMLTIAREAETDPDILHSAPHNTPVRRLDEATAARKPVLQYNPEG
ncbi:MAG: aminomethyl-transferring glycine dehydrogenase subunit GcvPB [Armatimonadetes bacterium]|nr:aminomethyl-transferring glycine dehydrogenase subunit GcvPB [Armatimonadota bacterium]